MNSEHTNLSTKEGIVQALVRFEKTYYYRTEKVHLKRIQLLHFETITSIKRKNLNKKSKFLQPSS